jgi:hypothetical protein
MVARENILSAFCAFDAAFEFDRRASTVAGCNLERVRAGSAATERRTRRGGGRVTQHFVARLAVVSEMCQMAIEAIPYVGL